MFSLRYPGMGRANVSDFRHSVPENTAYGVQSHLVIVSQRPMRAPSWHIRYTTLLFLLFSCGTVCAAGSERETNWSGLSAIISGKRVIADLHAPGTVEGDVMSVNSTELRMKVIRSDDVRFSPKMEHAIPRPAIARLHVIERGVAGRILGAMAGAVGGFFVAGTIFDKPGQIPVKQAFAGAVAGAAGGFMLGRLVDRRRTTIRLLPD